MKKDHTEIPAYRLASADPDLPDGAFRFLSCLLSALPDSQIDAAFPVHVREWAQHLERSEKTIARWVGALTAAGYLKKCELRGCPPARYYRLNYEGPASNSFAA